jgi:hypothetical protein
LYIFDLSDFAREGNNIMKQFNVVFGGAVSGGHKVEEVKKSLAAVFKADEKKIDQLFEVPHVVLKQFVMLKKLSRILASRQPQHLFRRRFHSRLAFTWSAGKDNLPINQIRRRKHIKRIIGGRSSLFWVLL